MVAALKQTSRPVPKYLQIVAAEESQRTETAEFAMYCYWSGEAKLGSLNGVHSTRSGWRGGLEVVQVKYDPNIIQYKTLLDAAQKFDCATAVFTHTEAQQQVAKAQVGSKAKRVSGKMRDAKASDQKYQLLQTPLRHLPMTEMQATKVNSGLSRGKVEELLSPHQQQLLKYITQVEKKDKTALAGMKPPTNSSSLLGYQQKLIAKIHSVLAKK